MYVMRGDNLSKEVILEKYLIKKANYTHMLFEVELISHKNKSMSPQKVRISTIRKPEVIAIPAQLKENEVYVDGETRVERRRERSGRYGGAESRRRIQWPSDGLGSPSLVSESEHWRLPMLG